MRRFVRVLPLVVLVACSSERATRASVIPDLLIDTAATVGPPPVRSFPTSKDTINGWIARGDSMAIRRHAWDIWESLTSPSGKGGLPVWRTFHTGHELFEMVQRPGDPIPVNVNERPLAFNLFSPSSANFIAHSGLNFSSTIDSINNAFNAANTPVAQRQVFVSPPDSLDPLSLVLKPVYQFIAGDRVTALPTWAGYDPAHSNNDTLPTPETWQQGVAVDPTGKLPLGSTIMMSVNGGKPQPLKVVHLSSFDYVKITQPMVDSFTTFVRLQSDYVGWNNLRDSLSLMKMVKPGNIALLMAMHVTGKEIPNWTWQTFWWSPTPADPQYGADRPKSIPAPWNNYLMKIAYEMTVSPTDTTPRIAFNPYLETNLTGQFPTPTSPSWFGIHSNCMTCHRLAARGTADATGNFTFPPYGPAQLILPGDSSLFAGMTKTDFLWSVTFRAKQEEAKARAMALRKLRNRR